MNKKFTISEDCLNKAKQFAINSVGTSTDKYARRNQNNVERIIDQIKEGKVAEEIAYTFLSQKFNNIKKPDYEIYEKGQKSWDSDLKDLDSKLKFAVKGQESKSAFLYGKSWVFQKNANSSLYDVDKEIFSDKKDPNNFVCFVYLNIPKRVALVESIVKVDWLHEKNLFKPMQVQQLQSNKLAVYHDDLLEFQEEIFQI